MKKNIDNYAVEVILNNNPDVVHKLVGFIINKILSDYNTIRAVVKEYESNNRE